MKLFLVVALVAAAALQVVARIPGNREIIVGGQPAPAGRYPYMTGLLSSSTSRPYCGGALITPTVVYSAAHCPAPNFVSVGCLNVNDNCARVSTSSSIIHPDYNGSPVPRNDFRLIILSSAVTSFATMPFIADAGWASLATGQDVTVIGWGTTSSGGSTSDDLLEVEVDVISNAACASDYAGTGTVVEDNMICASRSGKDACQGDSGGPLFIRCDSTGADVLVGVVSWGIGCASPNFPGVYGRVSFADSWFRSEMSSLGQLGLIATPPPVTDVCGGDPAPVPTPPPTPAPTCFWFFC